MILSRIGWGLAILTVLCVAAIFFCPAHQGPYSAVNGPVTALQSAQAAARLRVAVIQAAFSPILNSRIPSLPRANFATLVGIEPQAPGFVDSSTILRC